MHELLNDIVSSQRNDNYKNKYNSIILYIIIILLFNSLLLLFLKILRFCFCIIFFNRNNKYTFVLFQDILMFAIACSYFKLV